MSQKTNKNVAMYAQAILKAHKPIQPYICSTLNDFQEERDFLANNIFPQLNELCNSRGTYFKAVDLSWSALGAPKSLLTNLFRQYSCLHSQHLKLCLDYVNSCLPFFICMLGQTYGDFLPVYSPFMFSKATDLSSLSKLEQNLYVAARNGYPWVLENPNCSLTEYEIIQAAFMNESQFQYFYFRTEATLLKILDEEKEERPPSGSTVNDEEKLKIGKLKAKIISKGLPVRFYKNLHELGELIFKDWSVVIEKIYPATLIMENIDYKHSFERFFHEEFTEKCKEVFVISKQSYRTFEILERFALKDMELDFTNTAAGSSLDSVLSLSYRSLCARPDVRMVDFISPGDEETKINIVRQHLSISSTDWFQQSRQALRKKPNLNPLKLTILANEWKECRIYRNEFQCMREYLELVSIQELWELILKRWIEDYSWTLKPEKANSGTVSSAEGLEGWVADALCLLCVAHYGLTEDELLQLLDMLGYRNHYKVTTLHWAAFRNATKHWVQEKPSGVLYFRHQSLRNAVEHKLLGVVTPVRESSPYASQNSVNQKKTHFHQILMRYFQRQTTFWRVYQELPWHMKMSGCWNGLCDFLSSPSITDFISRIQGLSFWTRLHLTHYWSILLEAGCDVSGAYLLSVAKIKADRCHKVKKRLTLSVLECRLFEVTAADKCRLIFCIGSFLKLMGKINEAEELFLIVEDMLVESQSVTEMLLKVQSTIGELYLEIGMTQEGFQYFQKAWSNLLCFPLSDLKDSRNLVKQKVRVLYNLAKAASEEYLKENDILGYATEVSKLLDKDPCDQATMKYVEGVLMFIAGDTSHAKLKLQECLHIRRGFFGEKNMLVGEIMEFLADLLFFLPGDSEISRRKQATEYYKQVIKIKENADTLASSSLIRKQLSISLSDTLCKLAGQLLTNDSCHHFMMEAVGYLYRSLDLRTTYLGSSHSSIHGILHLLGEIKQIRSKRCWPQGKSQQCTEGSSLWEHLLKVNYHSAQSSTTVSSAMRMSPNKLQRAKSTDLALHTIPDKSKCAKGKKSLKPVLSISAEEKAQKKTPNNAKIWNSPGKEAAKKKKDYSSKILSLGKTNGLVNLSRQRSLSAKSESREGQITTVYCHPLLSPLSTSKPWESISEFISEKWLFHSPGYSST
nr:putative tetratricopeptide repeat protein 41 isoform X2 [Microcebus murinus]